jgi:hypothetical protein
MANESLPLIATDSNGSYGTSTIRASPHTASLTPGSLTANGVITVNGKHTESSTPRSLLHRLSRSVRHISDHVLDTVAEHTGSIGYLGSMSVAVNSLVRVNADEIPCLRVTVYH